MATEKQIQGLTTAQVNKCFRKHLDPKALVIVQAGDFTEGEVGDAGVRLSAPLYWRRLDPCRLARQVKEFCG